tara:strand:+ start:760 stop:1578 length:819 start_codon:yes stop_codon:yes gene_type:complete
VLKKRVITAVLLGILVVGAVLCLATTVTAAVLGGFVLIAAWEWSGLIGWTNNRQKLAYSVLLALLAYCVWRWNESASLFSYLNIVALVSWLFATILVIVVHQQRMRCFAGIAASGVCGLVVLLPAWSGIVWLLENDTGMLLAFFTLIWVMDGMAFFVGKRWGKRRLASYVSPGKSWEGLVGGVGFGTIYAVAISSVMALSDAAQFAFVLTAVAAMIASVIGDLFESMLKRRVGMKDSGRILPGHGGVMDRIDGLVAATPIFVAGLYHWVNRL